MPPAILMYLFLKFSPCSLILTTTHWNKAVIKVTIFIICFLLLQICSVSDFNRLLHVQLDTIMGIERKKCVFVSETINMIHSCHMLGCKVEHQDCLRGVCWGCTAPGQDSIGVSLFASQWTWCKSGAVVLLTGATCGWPRAVQWHTCTHVRTLMCSDGLQGNLSSLKAFRNSLFM